MVRSETGFRLLASMFLGRLTAQNVRVTKSTRTVMRTKKNPFWCVIGLALSLSLGLLAGCAPTFKEVVAALPEEKKAAVEAAVAMARVASFEELDAVTTSDAIFKNSYYGEGEFGKRAYWEARRTKKNVDLSSYNSTMRDLKVNIIGSNAEVFYTLDTIKKGVGGERDWRGSTDYFFRLRKEDGRWKVCYFEK